MLACSKRPRPLLVVTALLLVGSAGCGTKYYPVRGKVTYADGTPVTEGLVVFESKDSEMPITARGEIQADGSYQLGTSQPGNGAPAGTYRVLVVPKTDPNTVDKKPQPSPPFDKRFMEFSTSGLVCEVKDGPTDFPIQVTKSKSAH
jgi:hypothetical protein